MEFDNGQGIIGAVMLSLGVTALADTNASLTSARRPT